MTYLNVVNNVLRRLRETEVATYNETDYSTMIGDFVNDAIALVQSSHNWHALFAEIDVTTVASTQEYTLDGLGQQGQIYYVYNDTANGVVTPWSLAHMEMVTNIGSGGAEGDVHKYAFSSVDTDDDPKVKFWNIPGSVQTITFHVKKDQSAASADATEILVPEQPVIQYAWAFAKEERGEGNFQAQFDKAKRILSDYISLDFERHPELGVWRVV